MNPSPPAINLPAACELLFHEMGEAAPTGLSLPDYFEALNALRVKKNWPMATQMSCFNPLIPPLTTAPLNQDLTPWRAFWDAGLICFLKGDPQAGLARMLACTHPLSGLSPDQVLVVIADTMNELLPRMRPHEVPILIDLAGRFDQLLRDETHLQRVPAENLLRDSLFYLSLKKPDQFVSAWEWNAQGMAQLKDRLSWKAKQMAVLLYPQQDEDKIDKALIEKHLTPLTDALLFLNEIKLRTRLILRLEKIETRMLKIAVPVQILMAECLRLATTR